MGYILWEFRTKIHRVITAPHCILCTGCSRLVNEDHLHLLQGSNKTFNVFVLRRRRRTRNYVVLTESMRMMTEHHGVSNHQQLAVCSKVFSCWHHKHQSSALLTLCEGNPPVTIGFPSDGQWPVMASDAKRISVVLCYHTNSGLAEAPHQYPFFFLLRLIHRLNKTSVEVCQINWASIH